MRNTKLNIPNKINKKDRLTEEFDNVLKQLTNLTPSGSEFVDDYEKCIKYVKDKMQYLRNKVKSLKLVEKENKELIQQLNRIKIKYKKALDMLDDGNTVFSSICKLCEDDPDLCDEDKCKKAIDEFLGGGYEI